MSAFGGEADDVPEGVRALAHSADHFGAWELVAARKRGSGALAFPNASVRHRQHLIILAEHQALLSSPRANWTSTAGFGTKYQVAVLCLCPSCHFSFRFRVIIRASSRAKSLYGGGQLTPSASQKSS